MDTVPTKGPDADAYWTVIRTLPSTLKELLSSVEAADVINRHQKEFRLTDEQRRAYAEFIRDILIGVAMPDNVSAEFATRLGVPQQTAVQMLRAFEQDVLVIAGLSIASIPRAYTGPTVEQVDGSIRLRYANVDDLLAAIEELEPSERLDYLNDAKKDNRILVLKAMSQLKLGTTSDGKPMTFTELVDREAPDFSAQDWVDVAQEGGEHLQRPSVRDALFTFLSSSDRLTALVIRLPSAAIARLFHAVLPEALAQSKPSVVVHVRLSPYFAGVYDRETGVNEERFGKFVTLPDDVRERLASPELAEKIGSLVREGAVPDQYAVAVAKTVFLVEVGDVPRESLAELFGKRLGLSPEQGTALAKRIRLELLSDHAPATGEESPLVSASVPTQPEPVPHTAPSEPIAPARKPQPERTNVVDLRRSP